VNEVSKRIAEEISALGPIPFARFMELALYCPNYGYYEREGDIIGRRGDYYTSVSVGSLFGELLGLQFAEWLQEMALVGSRDDAGAESGGLQIVEAGAHRGDLARDILTWLEEHRHDLFEKLKYWIVEPSARRQNMQREQLRAFERHVVWVADLAEVAAAKESSRRPLGVHGIIFSNELLDAMPVHRFGWDAQARAWFECGVTLQGGNLVWTRLPGKNQPGGFAGGSGHGPVPEFLQCRDEGLRDQLPDGFIVEWCPAAETWWHRAASALARGRLVTVDYGLTAEELLSPERGAGTLKAIREHRISANPLASPGEQDLTAHVNFTRIQRAGESAGLKTEAFQSQAQFLTAIAQRACSVPGPFQQWSSKRRREFQTLTHPEHLGRSFRVLVQSRT
jgi:SAM-dependent MidA family methyltransferase